MNSLSCIKSRAPRYVVLLAMAAIPVVIMLPVFRSSGLNLPLWVWIGVSTALAVINFVLFLGALSFMRWLQSKREQWDTTTKRWLRAVMLAAAVVFFITALYFYTR